MNKKKIFICLFLSLSCFISSLISGDIKTKAGIENEPSVTYKVHCQTLGWQNLVEDADSSGTVSRAKRIEAINISLANLGEKYQGSSIQYKAHCQSYGWMSWVKDGNMAGTTGKSKRMEAIRIKLSGAIANYYDVEYRVHCQSYGWMSWKKNGETAGTTGKSKRIEAIQIRLVEK